MIRNVVSQLGMTQIRSRTIVFSQQTNSCKVLSSGLVSHNKTYSNKSSTVSSLAEDIAKWEKTLDSNAKEKLFEIRVELTTLFEGGELVCNPNEVTVKQWQNILQIRSGNARRKEYNFIGRQKCWDLKSKEKQEKKRVKGFDIRANVLKERSTNQHIVYGLGHTTLLPLIRPSTINNHFNARLIQIKQFEDPKIIFDCAYDSYMNLKSTRGAAKQIMLAYSDNRKNLHPFDLHICNYKDDSALMTELADRVSNLYDPKFTMELHRECFTNLYPKDNLIYLTPYSKTMLSKYNGSDIFVIPGILDRGLDGPITLARAKQLQIRTAWFPLTGYVPWNGNKALPSDVIVRMLLEFKNKQDWKEVFYHIPRRKLGTRQHPRQALTKYVYEECKPTVMLSGNEEFLPKTGRNPFKIDEKEQNKINENQKRKDIVDS